jgi:demethylmenaquinone methyltransferase/2-methoxy-6-polyprenyl-1,4-benzoquinol methylase
METTGSVLHWAGLYDFLTAPILAGSEQSIRKASLIKEGNRVLDVGCGTGRLTMAASRWVGSGGEVWGIDPSAEMIQVARKNAGKRKLAVHFESGVIEKLPFEDGNLDVVLNRLMFHHLPGDLKQRGLAEIRRVLKPGGICLIVDFEPPKKGLLKLIVNNHMGLMKEVNVQNYLPLMIEAGFGEVETGTTGSKLLSWVRGRKAADGGPDREDLRS